MSWRQWAGRWRTVLPAFRQHLWGVGMPGNGFGRSVSLASALALAFALALSGTASPAAARPATTDVTTQIVGGEYVSSAPWAAALYVNGRVWCSGSIISSRWVLTAKH